MSNSMKKMTAKIAVGVCVKNNGSTIKAAIDSVLNQKYPRELTRLIIVDGCSTDNTLPIINNLISETDMPVKILSDQGKGLGAARQMVVDNVKEDYVIFVDGDVELPEDFVQKQVDFMEKNPKVATACGRYMFREGNLISTVWCLANHVSRFLGNDATIYRTEALRQVGGFDKNMRGTEDKDAILRICRKGWTFAINERTGFFHNSRESFREFWKEQIWWGSGNHYLNHKHRCLGPLWRSLPAGSFMYGLKLAMKSYGLTHRRASFLIPSIAALGKIAWWVGFIKAHLNGYGHGVVAKEDSGDRNG